MSKVVCYQFRISSQVICHDVALTEPHQPFGPMNEMSGM